MSDVERRMMLYDLIVSDAMRLATDAVRFVNNAIRLVNNAIRLVSDAIRDVSDVSRPCDTIRLVNSANSAIRPMTYAVQPTGDAYKTAMS